jgi:protocatechuate 3,4-dioxygenase beta subunit
MSNRRIVVLGSAALIGLPALHLRAQGARRPTPAQTEGPFYPVQPPEDTDTDLLQHGSRARYAKGQPAWVEGTVADVDGRPLAGAAVEIWQCDADGRYHHPGDGGRADAAFQGFGRAVLGSDGRYRFRTLRPVAYGARAPHIHFKVRMGAQELLTTQLYVEGDPGNARDGLWRSLRDPVDRAALTRPFVAGADGLRAEFPIVVRA